MTTAGSVSALAEALGVSRRTAGRWLREGETQGVKAIPPAASTAINGLFQIHKEIVIAQARSDKIPYSAARPVFLERKMLRTGSPGDRVVAERTNFIRNDLRRKVIIDQQKSERYIAASVRSVIDLNRYFRLTAEGELKAKYQNKPRKSKIESVANETKKNFVNRENRERNRIIDTNNPFPIYTSYANISPLLAQGDHQGVDDLEAQLRQKHEPATGGFGTVAADQILLQLIPAQYVKPKRKAPAAKKQAVNRGGSQAKKAR